MATAVSFDTDALKRSIEERDADALVALYADDAEVSVVDQANPPSNPLRLKGRDAIAEWVQDVTSRDMTHEVADLVGNDERVSYSIRCRYPDGSKVLCMTTLELSDGRIARQSGIQAWDAG
jgi:hypothetical protein